jgi:predicted GH43/DUF377 family glycosyl hydrolase
MFCRFVEGEKKNYMKWKKLGLIFSADNHYDWMVTHAAVPFAECVKDNLFRVYFSTRDKYNRSHVAYVEIDIQKPQTIINLSEKPILLPGNLGAFDDSGVMLSWITDYKEHKYLYYIGWNLGVTVPFRNSIGLAISRKDNLNFTRYSEGPIIDRSLTEPHFCASSCVIKESQKFKMWYLSCVKWELVNDKPQHWYNIKYAESNDGVNWIRNGTVCIDFKSIHEYAISRPSVIKDDKIYKMWYSYRGSSYRIGYAESNDGINWTRLDEQVGIDVSNEGWDSEMIEYPYVFDHKDKRYMLYNGNGYGKTGFGLAIMEDD